MKLYNKRAIPAWRSVSPRQKHRASSWVVMGDEVPVLNGADHLTATRAAAGDLAVMVARVKNQERATIRGVSELLDKPRSALQ
jgi:hypothetical protein